ncbi:MAG TPA: hypothetical protein VEI03_05300 [Stellaceae bacterium]|nr:hypothetical protein [Stellaceae bacterium]
MDDPKLLVSTIFKATWARLSAEDQAAAMRLLKEAMRFLCMREGEAFEILPTLGGVELRRGNQSVWLSFDRRGGNWEILNLTLDRAQIERTAARAPRAPAF